MNRFFNCFFKVLEERIESSWNDIKCEDVFELYFNFWERLKKETGSATGFTGLSEVIIFMILKKLIEKETGRLDTHQYTKETYYFSNLKFAIGRCLKINIDNKTSRTPDIVIWKNPPKDLKKLRNVKPDWAIEIKVYTAKKSKEAVGDAVCRLKPIKDVKESFKGMLIFYHPPSKFNEVKNPRTE